MVDINLSHFIDQSVQGKKEKVPIDKCPDKDAYLVFSVKSTLINIASGSDTMSMMSGLDNISVDSGPETEYDFKNDTELAGADHATSDIDSVGVNPKLPPKVVQGFRRRFISAGKRGT